MNDYYALINGVFYYRFMPVSVDDIPIGGIKTNWFWTNMEDPSTSYWVPVENSEGNYDCELIKDNYENDISDGVFIVYHCLGTDDYARKISNNY